MERTTRPKKKKQYRKENPDSEPPIQPLHLLNKAENFARKSHKQTHTHPSKYQLKIKIREAR